jgi:RHS repeat-associated protein
MQNNPINYHITGQSCYERVSYLNNRINEVYVENFEVRGPYDPRYTNCGTYCYSISLLLEFDYLNVFQCSDPSLPSGSSCINYDPKKNIGCPCNTGGPVLVGNPINVATGNKYESDVDYNASELSFSRYYNSDSQVRGGRFGPQWLDFYDRSIVYLDPSTSTSAVATRPDGQEITFTKSGTQWVSTADVSDRLTETTSVSGSTTWTLFVANTKQLETYTDGRLISISDQSGQLTTLSYTTGVELSSSGNTLTPGLLLSVADRHGRTLTFGYDDQGHVVSLIQPDGGIVHYGYNGSGYLTTLIYPDNSSRQYLYDETGLNAGSTASGKLTGIVDEGNSRFATFAYQADGRAISTKHGTSAGLHSIIYAADGLSATVTYPTGVSATLNFNNSWGAMKVSGTSQPCGSACGQSAKSEVFDVNGYISQSTDFNGNVTSTTYDTNGLLDKQIDTQSTSTQRTTTITWDTGNRVPLTHSVTDADGVTKSSSAWVYNGRAQATAYCDIDPAVAASYTCAATGTPPAGVRRTTYSYCDTVDTTQCPLVGLLLAVDGPRTDISDITHYTYYLTTDESGCGTVGGTCHRAGDLYQATDALGHVSTMVAYDKNGRLIRSQDSNTVLTDLTYTPRGWLHTRSTGGATTAIDYDPTGTVHKITDPDGVYVTYTYDAAHRLTDITDALGNHIHYTLDAAGNKTQEDTYDSGNTLRRTLSRSFNTLGQLTGVTDGLSHTVFNATYSDSYDANGNLVHTADGLGVQRKQGYDALNRLVSTIDNYNGTDTATQNTQATFAYDALDNLEGVTDPDGLSTIYDYDGLSNPKALHSPDTGTSSFQTDAAGNRIQQTDAKGIVRTTSYDAINRPVTVSYPDSTQNIAYHYDEADSTTGCSGSFPSGRLTRIVETAVTTTYCYDSHGNVTKKSQAQGSQVDVTSYTYTAADRLSSITTPSQTVTQYSRDVAGRISGVAVTPNGSTSQAVVSAISYLPFGPISSYTLGNGQIISRSYDANYQLTDLTSPALNLHFARDVMGNITALGNSPGANPAVETYSYDPLYRLTGVADGGNSVESYTYSKVGDRLSKTKLGGVATGTYGYDAGTHHLASIGSAARTYDANGNTVGSSNAGETFGYGYSARNRMSIVQRDQATVANYVYNALNERVAKTVTLPQSVSERFVYNEASQLIGEYGSTSRDYIWLGSLPVAVVDNSAAASINYVHADSFGTPRAVENSAGSAIWQWAYQSNPFGEAQPTGSYVYNLRLPGQYFDAETGLHYNVNRNYETVTGRYLQGDPIGLNGGFSAYGYVGARPLMSVDMLGMQVAPEPLPEEAASENIPAVRATLETMEAAAKEDARQEELNREFEQGKLPGRHIPLSQFGETGTCRAGDVEEQTVGPPGSGAPNFVVTPRGVVFPVPAGARGPLAIPGGMEFQGGSGGNGLDPRTSGFRYMDPRTNSRYSYPDGYGTYNNEDANGVRQGVDPLTGRTIPNSAPMRHIPGG